MHRLMGAIYGELAARPAAGSGERAIDVLAHRAPDRRETWQGDGIFLAVRGAPLLWNEDGSRCVVLDGTVYNAAALRRELGGAFRGLDDAEVVLRAFERWGADCLERLNGAFALALWDARARTLLLARDRLGEKPLAYLADRDRLVFASELKAVLADERTPRRVDPHALASFLAFGHTGAAVTMFAGIRKLPPGHRLTARDGNVRIEPWWEAPPPDPGLATADEEELAGRVLELLADAVRVRTPTDEPVAVLLSGGVDSAAVAALAGRRRGADVKTFSLGYADGGTYDELAGARRNAAALGTDHHELRIDHGELLRHLRALVYHYDEPLGIQAGFNFFVLGRVVREHARVVLTGDGGDELFGGYRRHVAEQLAPLYQRLPRTLTLRAIPSAVASLPRLGRSKQIAAVLPLADPALRYPAWLAVLTPELRAEILGPRLRDAIDGYNPAHVYRELLASRNGGERLGAQLYAELKAWLPDTLFEKTDKAMAASGLDTRMPLLDHRLVELAFSIPDRHKIRRLATKRVLRRAVRELVPAHTVRKRKHGFTIPIDPWFRGPVAPYARELLLDERARNRGYFEPRVVERLLDEHARGRNIWGRALWMLLGFELWHRIYLDRESD
jgi:asparagine synthase (glutamine-hydrolysing)